MLMGISISLLADIFHPNQIQSMWITGYFPFHLPSRVIHGYIKSKNVCKFQNNLDSNFEQIPRRAYILISAGGKIEIIHMDTRSNFNFPQRQNNTDCPSIWMRCPILKLCAAGKELLKKIRRWRINSLSSPKAKAICQSIHFKGCKHKTRADSRKSKIRCTVGLLACTQKHWNVVKCV